MRTLRRLNIKDVAHLCRHLHVCRRELDHVCVDVDRYYYRKDRQIGSKVRPTATPSGRLRWILDHAHELLGRVQLPDSIHGGRKGHSTKTNAARHIRKPALLQSDLQDFFPSVSPRAVYCALVEGLGCSPDVAHYLTRLTTLDGCLPQGSPTSTDVAAIVTAPLARRLEGLARAHGGDFTLYVDDISLSGPGYLGSLTNTVRRIVEQEGFRINREKTTCSAVSEERVVTGVRVDRGIDAPSALIRDTRRSIEALERQLCEEDSRSLQLLGLVKGRINYIACLNPGAARSLKRRLAKVVGVTHTATQGAP